MKKKAEQVTVGVGQDGMIHILQDVMGHDEMDVAVHPEQIDLLTKWLNEAKAEAESRTRSEPPE